MRRGDLVTISLQGDYGKPRPALVIQSDMFSEARSKTVLPLTSTLIDAPLIRVQIEPTPQNRLRAASHVMIDKAATLPVDKLGASFGTVNDATMVTVNRALALFLGLAG